MQALRLHELKWRKLRRSGSRFGKAESMIRFAQKAWLNGFSLLSVERGTVISATRDFKELNLKAILRSHNIENVEQVVGAHPSVGGYTKFARTVLNKQTRVQQFRAEKQPERHGKNAQLKKGGRGWLHQ